MLAVLLIHQSYTPAGKACINFIDHISGHVHSICGTYIPRALPFACALAIHKNNAVPADPGCSGAPSFPCTTIKVSTLETKKILKPKHNMYSNNTTHTLNVLL